MKGMEQGGIVTQNQKEKGLFSNEYFLKKSISYA